MAGMSEQFLTQIGKEMDLKVKQPIDRMVREVGKLGYDQVTALSGHGGRTPLYTGFYRAHWRLTVSKPSEVHGNEAGIPKAKGAQGYRIDQYAAAYNASRSSAERSLSVFSINTHTGIFLTNNTSYATAIEAGNNYYGPGGILNTAFQKMNTLAGQTTSRI